MLKYEKSKYAKKEAPSFSDEEKQKMVGILSAPEIYDFSKLPKVRRTKQTDELNFYIPEKWKR